MISEGGTKGGTQQSPRYRLKKLYAFLNYFVKIGNVFNFYCNEILSFLDNAGKNEGSEMYSSPELAGWYTFSSPDLLGQE